MRSLTWVETGVRLALILGLSAIASVDTSKFLDSYFIYSVALVDACALVLEFATNSSHRSEAISRFATSSLTWVSLGCLILFLSEMRLAFLLPFCASPFIARRITLSWLDAIFVTLAMPPLLLLIFLACAQFGYFLIRLSPALSFDAIHFASVAMVLADSLVGVVRWRRCPAIGGSARGAR